MRSIARVMSGVGVLCLLAGPAFADGVLLVQKVTVGSAAPTTHQIQIEQHRMRAETAGGPGGMQVFVFDGTHERMLMIDDANKAYSEITKADLDALSGQMASAMSQMQEQLKNMPPEQRKQMEAIMSKGGAAIGRGAAASPKIEYHKVGTDKVGKWTCDKYEGTRDGKKVQEMCTVDPKVLGFTTADFAVTKDLAAFFQKMMPAAATQMFHIGTVEEQGFSGVPVRSVTTAGTTTITSEITDVRRESFADSLFQAPAGYKKTDSPFAGRGRGRQ